VLWRETVGTQPHTDDLITAIDRLFRRAGRQPRDLTAVAVSAGPGGYTAVRIAIATAKMICEATGAACHAVPTAHAVAARVVHGGVFGVGLGSKGESVFVTRFEARADGGSVRALDQGRLITAADLAALSASLLVVDRFVPPTVAARAAELGIGVRAPEFDAVAVAELAAAFAPVDPAALAPIYPREPEAVTKWRQLKGG